VAERLKNYIAGRWVEATARENHDVHNPATGELLAHTPLCGAAEVDKAVQAAKVAFQSWRRVPPVNRARYLFKFKSLLDDNAEELARLVTIENGKTLPEARGSVRRGIECVEVACGAPSLLMGQALEDVAEGIDSESVRQPVGVFAAIAPFNFPAMVPLWFYPFAVACGNTFLLKPSEQVPLSQMRMFELLDECKFPDGVLNLVHGGKAAVQAIVEHPDIRGVSCVGSSPVAQYVYQESAKRGKRVQSLGGAKNFMVVMPDADRKASVDQIMSSAYGCAGERCLAASVILPVGEANDWLREELQDRIAKLKLGNGLEADTGMGPVISAPARERILGYIEKGIQEGAELVADGRKPKVDLDGYFVGATLFDKVNAQ
jgi:malonate-semialdehyde dehydrogenase (acetylating)/methylmalonate-semialdehyde dehydrogenase